MADQTARPVPRGALSELFTTFLVLGLTSFGGPVAHLGYFRAAFVERRKWLSEASYAEIVALCQFLPGPASSQVGIAIGLIRAGYAGALAAWLAFTLPSFVLMVGFALGLGPLLGAGALHALKIAALAVVVQAVWAMAKSLTPDRPRLLVALAVAAMTLLWPSGLVQLALLALAALLGGLFLRTGDDRAHAALAVPVSRRAGAAWLTILALVLLLLPLLAQSGNLLALLADKMARSGALVFGGGHVVLPLLEAEFVTPGLVGRDTFLAGYGAAQALPGPLFAFAAHVGTSMAGVAPLAGALVAILAIYLPAFLLVLGALPFWASLSGAPGARGALSGANAAVVGLLLAAAYDPVFTSAVAGPGDFAFALAVLAALVPLRLPPWLVVLGAALAGWGLQAAGLWMA